MHDGERRACYRVQNVYVYRRRECSFAESETASSFRDIVSKRRNVRHRPHSSETPLTSAFAISEVWAVRYPRVGRRGHK